MYCVSFLTVVTGDSDTLAVTSRLTSLEGSDGSKETLHGLHHRVPAGQNWVGDCGSCRWIIAVMSTGSYYLYLESELESIIM